MPVTPLGSQADVREIGERETALAFAAMQPLRPALEDEASFAAIVDGELRPAGYRLIGAFLPGATNAVAVAGFRVGRSLGWGHYLYVDDVSTAEEHRRAGHAHALLAWLEQEASRVGADQLHLDSGVGLDRAAAHRLYLTSGYFITSHHFARLAPHS